MATRDSSLRPLVLVIAALVVLSVLVGLFVFPLLGMWTMGHMGPGPGGAWRGFGMGLGWIWPLLSVLLLVGLLVLGYVLYRAARADGTDTALEELRVAYARGDLTDEEFEERRDRLQGP